jgi:hypothetical protein
MTTDNVDARTALEATRATVLAARRAEKRAGVEERIAYVMPLTRVVIRHAVTPLTRVYVMP